MTWGKFERIALEPDDNWLVWLVWPQFFIEMAFLVSAPIRDWLIRLRTKEKPQTD